MSGSTLTRTAADYAAAALPPLRDLADGQRGLRRPGDPLGRTAARPGRQHVLVGGASTPTTSNCRLAPSRPARRGSWRL